MQEKLTTEELTKEFLINRDAEETRLTLQFAKAMLDLDAQIKEIKEDQKAIKAEAKDEGVSVQKVTKAMSQIKAYMKTKDTDLTEIEMIKKVLDNDPDVKTMISELVKK